MINYSVSGRYSVVGDTSSDIKYYANIQTESMTFSQFCAHIADHGSVYTRADVMAIVAQVVDCLRELLLEGKSIDMYDLGTFYPTLKSTGADSMAEFTSDNIYDVSVRWVPGELFEDMIDDAEFTQVVTRAQAAAVIAALESGSTTVDLSTATDEDSTEDEDEEDEEDSDNV